MVKDKAKHKKKATVLVLTEIQYMNRLTIKQCLFFLCEMSCSFLKLVLAVNNAHTDTVPQTHTRLGTFNPLIVGIK